MKPTHLAIDFGTSNSLVAAANQQQIFDPIPLDSGAADPTIFRTLLYFPNAQQVFYGADALARYGESGGDGRLLRSIKRQLPIRSFIGTFIDDRPFNLEDLIALFLKEVRQRAGAHFNHTFTHAVIGRPARFSEDEVDDKFAEFRLSEAARRAGFTDVQFCPEPLAAAYEFRSQISDTKLVLVADFGGGTSDFTVVRIGKRDFQNSDVLAIGGVALAGDALDGAVMRKEVSTHFGADVEYKVPFGHNILRMPAHLISKISSPGDISFLALQDAKDFLRQIKQWALASEDRAKMDRFLLLIEARLGFHVFERIERAKRVLSSQAEAPIVFDYPGIEWHRTLTCEQFERACAHPVQAILRSLDETVAKAGVKFADIDIVCCTGGTAKVPLLARGLAQRFGQDKLREHEAFHSVVKGLALRAQEWARGFDSPGAGK